MAYSELVKDFNKIRAYIQDFYIYGFKTREEFADIKSLRGYDNERRRVESWLGCYMSFRKNASGKNIFITADSKFISKNPLHMALKAKSFTRNDINLHFILIDILQGGVSFSLPEIVDAICENYLPFFENPQMPDEATIRNKLKEYCGLGIIKALKEGKRFSYKLVQHKIDLKSWSDAVSFFSQTDPIGVIGSFTQSGMDKTPCYFSFKHNYMFHALESCILYDLLIAMSEKRRVEIELRSRGKGKNKKSDVTPLKIFVSLQGGRRYVAVLNHKYAKIILYRLDLVSKVVLKEIDTDYLSYKTLSAQFCKTHWGVSSKVSRPLEHVEMLIHAWCHEWYIIQRLIREKRCGEVKKTGRYTWLFTADISDSMELLPWIRTFTGRILSLTCSNSSLTDTFYSDLEELHSMYGCYGDTQDAF